MKRIALALALAILPLVVYAGTTGSLTGTLTNSRGGAPVANATVVASAGSQIATTRSDARGRFVFLSLGPDVYSIDVQRTGFNPVRVSQVAVFADTSVHLELDLTPVLVFVIHDYARRAEALVRPGLIPDVYSFGPSSFSIAPPAEADLWMLRMAPGVTFGPSSAIMH